MHLPINIGELLQLVNLLLVPIFIYIVKLERNLASMEQWRENAKDHMKELGTKVDAVHKRLDQLHLAAAAREID